MASEFQQNIRIEVGISPREADIIVVSISTSGAPGALVNHVMRELGTKLEQVPPRALESGFFLKSINEKQSILYIVTVGLDETNDALHRNLLNALIQHGDFIRHKLLWIPLMGTGAGGLTLQQSYAEITSVIRTFENELGGTCSYLISLPDSFEGREFDKYIKGIVNENDRATNIIENLTQNIYLVGSFWEGNEQKERFFKMGIWENGDSDYFPDLVNSAQPGDILFLKSTFAGKGVSYLRIKAVGLVTHNPLNAASLMVDWRIQNILIDIEHLGFYRNRIARVEDDKDITTIITTVGVKLLIESGILQDSGIEGTDKGLVNLLADTPDGTDYLKLNADVDAFARVIASDKFTPPMAIAVLGKWGSGKSFFMKKLQDRIDQLADLDTNQPKELQKNTYKKGIAHLHFNAWSYLDANLWAGLSHSLFEKLYEYISENTKGKVEELAARAEISAQIQLFESDLAQLHKKEDRLQSLNEELKQKIEENRNQLTLKRLLPKLEAIFGKESDELVAKTPAELKDFFQHGKRLFHLIRADWKKNVLWISIIAALVTLILVVEQQFGFSLKALINQWWLYCTSLLVPVVRFIKNKIDINKVVEILDVLDSKEDAEKLSAELEKLEQEKILLSKASEKLELSLTKEKSKLANPEHTISRFIQSRYNEESYKSQLGIVSQLRKDFELLSELFASSNNSSGHVSGSQQVMVISPELFKDNRRLERIVLYIDDLDRCSEEKVVEVLEAVNLLMAFKLFVVVVGIDQRWVKNALHKKHRLHFRNTPRIKQELINPSDYLDKIFQIPFHLKQATDDEVKYMLERMTFPFVEKESKQSSDSKTPETIARRNESSEDQQEVPQNSAEPATGELIEQDNELKLEKKEIEVMQELSSIIGNNPRSIKRFMNIYLVIRSHREISFSKKDKETEMRVLLLILAASVNRKKQLYSELCSMNVSKNGTVSFKSLITDSSDDAVVNILFKDQLNPPLYEHFRKFLPVVSRFTFE